MGWLSAGIGLASSLLGSSSKDKANKQNQANIDEDRKLQKDFAQKGIRWRVEDAKGAGIHPLYAMGASIPGFNPSAINIQGNTSISDGLKTAGQDIDRAITATQTKKERLGSLAYKLSMERAALENELLRSQIAKNSQVGPALPSALDTAIIPGQGDASMNVQPMLVNPSAPGRPHQETGAVADTGFVKTPTGLALVPSLDAKERIEDQIFPEAAWAIRNNLVPLFNPSSMAEPARKPNPQQFPLPPGHMWKWSKKHQEYRPYLIGSGTLSDVIRPNPAGWAKSRGYRYRKQN